MVSPRGELIIESSDPGHVIATYNPLLVAAFTRSPRLEELEALEALSGRGLADGIRGGILYVVARKEMSGGIDPRVRAVFEKMIRKNQGATGSSAVVVLTTGFGAAMVRGALTSLLQLTSRRKMLQVFATVEQACEWLAREHALDAGELLRVYQRATASLAP